MFATKIEIRTKALRAGRNIGFGWEPAGQIVATIWIPEPGKHSSQIAAQILHLDGEEVVATVAGREEIPTE